MKREAKNRPMEIIEKLRKEAKMSKTEISKGMGSRTRYYEHLEANDVKFGIFTAYLDKLGYEFIIRKKGTAL